MTTAATDVLEDEPAGPPSRRSDFSPLLQAVRAHGLLRSRRRHYAAVIAADFLGFAAVWAGIWVLGATWWTLLLAPPAALFSTRVIFIGHDVGHRQVARTRAVNHAIALFVGDLVTGMSAHWWVDKHNRHHANPNVVGRDPDVGDGALVWTPAQAQARTRPFARWAARHQAQLYFPMLLLQAMNLRLGTFRAIRGPRDVILPVAHVVLYLGGLVLLMGPGRAAVFVLAHQALLGLHLGCAFAPNHKGMPMPDADERQDFLSKQVLTSRNVKGGRVVDWMLGGLNYQIEHHLFPSMPRFNLRRAQRLVVSHCGSLGLPYTQASLRASLVLTVRHLNDVGRTVEPRDRQQVLQPSDR